MLFLGSPLATCPVWGHLPKYSSYHRGNSFSQSLVKCPCLNEGTTMLSEIWPVQSVDGFEGVTLKKKEKSVNVLSVLKYPSCWLPAMRNRWRRQVWLKPAWKSTTHSLGQSERVWDTDTLNQWVNYISLAWMQFLSLFYSYLAFALLGNLCFMGSLDNILYCLLLTHR